MSDSILLWNEVALEANRVSHTNGRGEQAGPPLSARALAIAHLAMYDAYAAVTGDPALPPYLTAGTLPVVPPTATPEAAITGAAYRALLRLFPSQRPFFDFILESSGDEGSAGHNFGVAVADAILSDRNGDPGPNSTTYTPSSDPGRHRLDPDNLGQGFHAPDYGKLSKGFAIGQRHELAAPPFRNSEYDRALYEVRGKGIKSELRGTLHNSDGRTVNQTLIGIFWAYDGAFGLGTPPRLYNQIIRRIAATRSPGNPTTPNSVAQNAKLFALVNVAMADAGILAWDQKYKHDFWRPVVGIREHDTSMGPGTSVADDEISEQSDPWWLPLGAPNTNRLGKNFTPPFPAYPSGHATFGAAAFHTTRLFYGEGGRYSAGNLTADSLFSGLSFVSEECDGINTDNGGAARPKHARAFPDGLWQMIEENGRSRVYLGVHWVFDAFSVDEDGEPALGRPAAGDPIGGVPLGLEIAEDIFDRITNAVGGGPAWKSTVGPR
jgi:Vanadium chloroperoxidase N-terminal domain